MIQGNPKDYDELKERIEEIQNNRNGMNWYLSFKKIKQVEDETKEE